jgi:hypothetical protein
MAIGRPRAQEKYFFLSRITTTPTMRVAMWSGFPKARRYKLNSLQTTLIKEIRVSDLA